MRILISPYSRVMRNGEKNPKNYPYWSDLVKKLVKNGHLVTQVGVENEVKLVPDMLVRLSLDSLRKLMVSYDTWISVDNFFPHLANHVGKRGIVLFGKSDPLIYGYPQNINLLKDRKYLREKQFDIWEAEKFDENVFVSPEEVIKAIQTLER